MSKNSISRLTDALLSDLRSMIDVARNQVAQAVNSAMVELYWLIGRRIREDILKEERAEYGKEVVEALGRQLTIDYGKGFSRPNLFHMIKFHEVFPDAKIVYSLSRQLSWTHFRQIIYVENPLAREFYAEMCRVERWSTRTLQAKIGGMLFERTAISRKPAQLAEQELASLRDEDRMTPDLVFRDPYVLDFLDLADTYNERDLEAAILREIEAFLLELGTGFTFVARQKRITVDNEDFFIDLLLYHRRLRRLVVIELKLDAFRPQDKGQVELYLRWLAKHEQLPGEESPLGLILCTGKSTERIELLQLEQSGIRVAEYMTELPPPEVLRRKLHDAVQRARGQEQVRGLPPR